MKHILIILLTLLISSTAFGLKGEKSQKQKIRRFALIVGKNDGGDSRIKLRYANRDASAISHIFGELGGVYNDDKTLLLEPTKDELLKSISRVKAEIAESKSPSVRTEFFVYYSGHSDETGLLIGNDKINYTDLKAQVLSVPADINIVILDSCSSGALTKIKGGKKIAPFLTDATSNLKGRVFLTSSSSDEAAQESDKIKSSYFTHYLVSGLRGAADNSRDGKVTLNEAYQYAFNETLAKTEKTMSGAQHPSYDINITGSGELVMTDIRKTSARLILDKSLIGRFYIRDDDQKLVAEVNKINKKPIEIGLSQGEYLVILRTGNKILKTTIYLEEKKIKMVALKSFQEVDSEDTTIKGLAEVDYIVVPAEFSIVPKLTTGPQDRTKVLNNFHLGLVYIEAAKIEGVAIAYGATWITEDVEGVQIASGFNMAEGQIDGAQVAFVNVGKQNIDGAQVGFVNLMYNKVDGAQIGFVNISKHTNGAQIGFVNLLDKEIDGSQIGFTNIARNIDGAQIGFANVAKNVEGTQVGFVNYSESPESYPIGVISIVKGGRHSLGYSYDDVGFHQLTIKLGSKYTYSMIGLGKTLTSSTKVYNVAFGVGGHIPIGRFHIDIESEHLLIRGDKFFDDKVGTHLSRARLAPGFNVYEGLSIFAGVTYNLYKNNDKDDVSAAEAFKEHRGNEDKKWVGYTLGVEYDF